MLTPMQILSAILDKPTDLDHVRSLVTPDVTYVSLNQADPDLKRIMPWCGTSRGPESIVKTFVDVGRYWEMQSFEREALFGADEYAAMFGRFTYKSTVLSKLVTSPFAVFAKCEDGRCSHLQFMEDTFATAASFRSGGTWTFRSNPNGERVEI
ncbi:MAG TPA: nuclear transport factor 2 family protein [Steroidobacteraceae bacterium]|nr:nuclear transport factor 2 family protein [Steroidobacteraceae bacterium]